MQPTDFETLPIGTGAELARLNDLVQSLTALLKEAAPYAEKDSALEIKEMLERAGL